ncbi:hypothetical protein ACOBQX_29440 [Actinokineospora sp. G85]|uniref:hypothetical protein n=1 Tax=Actinokineospora sp. G85 TaxID=3406626 RepID=UPI003C773159
MVKRVSVRNAQFQQWHALLGNRTKRQRAGEFLIHGVRPITLAVERGWPLTAVLRAEGPKLSGWAQGVLAAVEAPVYSVAADLMAELSERADDGVELIAVGAMPPTPSTASRSPPTCSSSPSTAPPAPATSAPSPDPATPWAPPPWS